MPDPLRLVDGVPERDDRVARAEWERDAKYLPPGPPYDLEDRLAATMRDARYLVDTLRSYRRLAQLWLDRYESQQSAAKKLLMAADRGGSLEKHLDALRDLMPPTVYRRPR